MFLGLSTYSPSVHEAKVEIQIILPCCMKNICDIIHHPIIYSCHITFLIELETFEPFKEPKSYYTSIHEAYVLKICVKVVFALLLIKRSKIAAHDFVLAKVMIILSIEPCKVYPQGKKLFV